MGASEENNAFFTQKEVIYQDLRLKTKNFPIETAYIEFLQF